jgi:hypothetical protein
MDTNRFKVMVALSSDHAGISRELASLESAMRHALAHIDDPRKVRDYLHHLAIESTYWCGINDVDDRGWMERTRTDYPREPWEQTKARWNDRKK